MAFNPWTNGARTCFLRYLKQVGLTNLLMHVSSAHITEYETNEISTIKTAVHAVTVDIKCISLIFESIPVRKTNLGHLGIFVLTLLLLCLRTYVILSSCLCVFDTLLCKRDVFHLLDDTYCVAWTLKLRRHDCVQYVCCTVC